MIEVAERPQLHALQARVSRPLVTLGRRLRVGLRRHGTALGIVVLACIVGQVITLSQTPRVVVDNDGLGYLQFAHALLVHHQLLNPERTPGYPGFLALIFSLVGEQNVGAVTAVQAVLVVIAMLEIYVLVYLVARRRWVAAALAALVGTNPYILDWERMVRDETLSMLIAVTLFLALAVYVRSERRLALAAFTVLSFALVLTRPAEVLLPFILLVLLGVRSLRLGRAHLHRRGPSLALSAVLICGVLGGYMIANASLFGFFGMTEIMNINLFGKVLEYRMQDESAAPQYAQVRADANDYVGQASAPGSTNALDPWNFFNYEGKTGPMHYAYRRDGFSLLGAYSKDIILHHPVQYTIAVVPDVIKGWRAVPVLEAPYSAHASWISRLLSLARLELLIYLLLPVALAVLIVRVWRAPRDDASFVLCLMMISTTATLIVNAVASYAEFYRLREPLDWAVFVSVDLLALGAVELVVVRLRPALEPEVYRLLARTGLLSSAPASSSARSASTPEAPVKQASRPPAPDTAPPQVDELDTFQMPIAGFQTREIHRRGIPKPSPSKPQRPGRFQR